MSRPLPTPHNIPVISKRSTTAEKMTAKELTTWMRDNGVSDKELAEIFGVTEMAVRHWVSGNREVSVTNSRLIRMFQKYPKLLKEF